MVGYQLRCITVPINPAARPAIVSRMADDTCAGRIHFYLFGGPPFGILLVSDATLCGRRHIFYVFIERTTGCLIGRHRPGSEAGGEFLIAQIDM